jgi:DNA repair protein RecO (recombination protein O)
VSLTLFGERLVCGFYVNELLMRLLHRHDAHEKLFDDYAGVLQALGREADSDEAALRIFEKHLLQELGYALILDRDGDRQIEAEVRYRYIPEQGPRRVNGEAAGGVVVYGATLLALAREDISSPRSRQEAKQLMRSLLNHHLEGKPLHSRRLFQLYRNHA